MEDDKKGTKAIGRVIDPKSSKPITHIKRQGEGEMGYATDPNEVDTILREAWGNIYEGNMDDPRLAAMRFLAEYRDHVYTAKEYKVGKISMDQVKEHSRRAAQASKLPCSSSIKSAYNI